MKTLSKNRLPILYDNLFPSVDQIVRGKNAGTSVIVPHVCNNINVFGAGFTAGIEKYYPIVKENFHLLGNKARMGYVQYVEVMRDPTHNHKLIFANMIAQNGVISKNNHRPLNYGSLVICMMSVASYIKNHFDKENSVQIHAPKFGSGLAGGNWSFIEELINDTWNNIPVFIYSHK
jgi:hypothetical protein